jgi:hypothetical protein
LAKSILNGGRGGAGHKCASVRGPGSWSLAKVPDSWRGLVRDFNPGKTMAELPSAISRLKYFSSSSSTPPSAPPRSFMPLPIIRGVGRCLANARHPVSTFNHTSGDLIKKLVACANALSFSRRFMTSERKDRKIVSKKSSAFTGAPFLIPFIFHSALFSLSSPASSLLSLDATRTRRDSANNYTRSIR